MTAVSASILNNHANDADHRTFAQAIHALLVGCGLTQTADSGQANLATITRPTAGLASGYEVFRFNDAEQATLPCFLKVEYGSGNQTAIPGLRVSFGGGSNGAGTLTGAVVLLTALCAGWDSTADGVLVSRPAFASYAEGQFVLAFGLDVGGARGLTQYIGRPRGYDGARTTDGLISLLWAAGATNRARVVQRAGGGGPAALTASAAIQIVPDAIAAQDDQVGANVALWPMYVGVNANLRFGSLFGYRAAAIVADAQQQIDVFGGLRNYRAMGSLMQPGTTAMLVPYF